MANTIRTGDRRGFNKGRSSMFREGSRVRQTPEEGRRTCWPKPCGNNNKDEDNSPKPLNDNNSTRNINICSLLVRDLKNTITCREGSGDCFKIYRKCTSIDYIFF